MTIEADYRDVELVDYETYRTLSTEEKMVQRLISAARVLSAMGLEPEDPKKINVEDHLSKVRTKMRFKRTLQLKRVSGQKSEEGRLVSGRQSMNLHEAQKRQFS